MCKGKKQRTESTTSVTMTPTISSLVSSCLAICSPLHVSVHCRLFLYSLSKKLEFAPVASAITAISQRSPNNSFLHLMARDTASCVSGSNRFRWPPVTDRRTDKYNFSVMIHRCYQQLTHSCMITIRWLGKGAGLLVGCHGSARLDHPCITKVSCSSYSYWNSSH